MRIHHIALWTPDLERLKNFYLTHFPARAGEKYENSTKGYASYFLYFSDGASIEIMQRADIPPSPVDPPAQVYGYAHLSIAVGSEEEVNRLAGKPRFGWVPAGGWPPPHGRRLLRSCCAGSRWQPAGAERRRMSQLLIAMAGLPGTGKSTLA